MSKKRVALQLLSEMVEMSEAIDLQRTKDNPDPSLPRGEGWFTFHLKKLRELVEDIPDDNSTDTA